MVMSMSRSCGALSILLATAALLLAFPGYGIAGSWKLEFDWRDQPSLTYSENGKLIFLLGCGHAFALHVKYPGTPKTSGSASVEIRNGRARMTLRGEFEEPSGDDQTTFIQWDLGFARQDADLYGRRWDRVRSRLLDLIAKADPLTIASGQQHYDIPHIDVSGWRRPIEKCGRV
ncbi:hypothetical protein [Bradyrhizobium sp. Ec3.3]|uniref:hypothetical protein n=1 Tax=Bradyrhizobium sp. Ec3.3 TaxID=189753 RepID=UPI0012EB0D3A|nr:hypothetical protein [Bradyrhizobium sp. Ec3.3]